MVTIHRSECSLFSYLYRQFGSPTATGPGIIHRESNGDAGSGVRTFQLENASELPNSFPHAGKSYTQDSCATFLFRPGRAGAKAAPLVANRENDFSAALLERDDGAGTSRMLLHI